MKNSRQQNHFHHSEVIMGAMASQITSLTIVYSNVYSGAEQRKHQSSVSLAFMLGIRRWPVNSPHIWSLTRKMFPFDDVIMCSEHNAVLGSFSYPARHCYWRGVEQVCKWISNLIPHIIMNVITYACWNHVSKRGPGSSEVMCAWKSVTFSRAARQRLNQIHCLQMYRLLKIILKI